MDKDSMQKKVELEDDYVRCPKCSNSLTKFLAKHPDGVDDKTIARLFMMTEEKVAKLYQEAVQLLQKEMIDGDADT